LTNFARHGRRFKPAIATYKTSADDSCHFGKGHKLNHRRLLKRGIRWAKTNTKITMKLFFILASLIAATQAQFSIGAPTSGATVNAGQNLTVQIIVPIDTVSYILRYMVGSFFTDLSRAHLQGNWKSAS